MIGRVGATYIFVIVRWVCSCGIHLCAYVFELQLGGLLSFAQTLCVGAVAMWDVVSSIYVFGLKLCGML